MKYSIDAALEDRPVVLGVNVLIPDVLDLVVDDLMGRVLAHAAIGRVAVGHQDGVLSVPIF